MNTEIETAVEEVLDNDALLKSLIDKIRQGVRLIETTDDASYRKITNGTGSVGAEFRHNLDFAVALLNGIETGRIDYNDRERDLRVEIDRRYAADRFGLLANGLAHLDMRVPGKSVLVRSELDKTTWLPSSFAREVEFVHSHTVHHHALISEKLAGYGIAATENFGVAPSTLEYWKKKAA